MRCPKCDYIGYDAAERCRNCGYDLSVDELGGSNIDPVIRDEPSSPDALAGLNVPDIDAGMSRSPSDESSRARLQTDTLGIGSDLPLFDETPGHRPRVAPPPPPRAPLGVRRPSAQVSRASARTPRPRPDEPELDLGPPVVDGAAPSAVEPGIVTGRAVPLGASRLGAGLIDVGLVGAVDLLVLYLTLRICGLTFSEVTVLPMLPLLSFFVILNGGYFVAFTGANGQTLGKMATGLKVVCHDGAPVDVSHAALRTAAYLASALPIGLGFVMSFFSRDHLALHDRLAETRVVFTPVDHEEVSSES